MHMDFCDISYEMSTIQYLSKLSLKILIQPKKKIIRKYSNLKTENFIHVTTEKPKEDHF